MIDWQLKILQIINHMTVSDQEHDLGPNYDAHAMHQIKDHERIKSWRKSCWKYRLELSDGFCMAQQQKFTKLRLHKTTDWQRDAWYGINLFFIWSSNGLSVSKWCRNDQLSQWLIFGEMGRSFYLILVVADWKNLVVAYI